MFLLPINLDKPSSGKPQATYILIVLNSALWVLPAVVGSNSHLIQTYGYRPAAPSVLTIFASMFLHVGFWHVAGNMWFLWMFARKIEERFGSFWFVVAYLVCGLGAAALHTLLAFHSSVPCVGASGAISGVAGIYFLLFPRSPFQLDLYFGWFLVKRFRAQTRGAVGAWITEQFILGVLTDAVRGGTSNGGGVAFWAHVGGFATGLLCASIVLLKVGSEEREMIIRPKPLTEDEKEEIFADRIEQPSGLTTLKLGYSLTPPKTTAHAPAAAPRE
ncbi:MAG TPA: rhomboid family intramembrane serine protease [Acidobacteriaceae bacterium]